MSKSSQALWRKNNPEKLAEYGRRDYAKHRKKRSAKAKEWRLKNKEKMASYRAKWESNNPEKAKATKQKWTTENKEKLKVINKAWHKRNKKARNEYASKYYAEHKEEIRVRKAKYAQEHPEMLRKSERARRATQLEVAEYFTPKMEGLVRSVWDNRCAICGRKKRPDERRFPIDHWLPLSKGHALSLSNAVLMCPQCNIKKGAKYPCEVYSEETVIRVETILSENGRN